jgi:hypothetical protein
MIRLLLTTLVVTAVLILGAAAYLILAGSPGLLGEPFLLWAIVAIVVGVIVVGYLSEAFESNSTPFTHRYAAALVIYALAVPYAAAFITVILLPPPTAPQWLSDLAGYNPFLAGAALAIAFWLVLPIVTVHNRLAVAEGPNPSSYGELRSRLNLLASNLKTLGSRVSSMTPRERAAYENAAAEKRAIEYDLRETGLHWVRGTGYIDLWKRLHRAEEELIQAQCKAEVIGGALEDHLRLHGCAMANKDELLRDLRCAVPAIKSEMLPYFVDEPCAPGLDASAQASTLKHKYPRAVLKTVRRTINEYRDEQRSGVVQVRNRLLMTALVTQIVALLLLGLAVTARARAEAIEAAAAFFLVGAVLGLLYNRLRTALEAGSMVDEDYGLSTARLWATPLFCGLAAVGGVLLVAVVPNVVDLDTATSPGTETTATATPAPTADRLSEPTVRSLAQTPYPDPQTAAADQVPSLGEIFTLDGLKLIIAAIFAASPAYLFDRLGQSDKLLSNLRSTQPANRENILSP